ncbi:MAG: T9SS type A sorting domain-containing protein [Bacteroidetes bacterium]|nr:T9SS type A sorting domain-containing protein [Bacteroidota bacterium]
MKKTIKLLAARGQANNGKQFYSRAIPRSLFCLLMISVSISSFAGLFYEVPIADRITNSKAIIEGRVLETKSFWNDSHGMLYTSAMVEVYKVFKGEIYKNHVEIISQGGFTENQVITSTTSLNLSAGDIGLFFTEEFDKRTILSSSAASATTYSMYAGAQGMIQYDENTGTANDIFSQYENINVVYNTISSQLKSNFKELKQYELKKPTGGLNKKATAAPVITSFTPTSGSGGIKQILTINGTGFGATRQPTDYVAFVKSEAPSTRFKQTGAPYFVSWSDTKIQVYIPSDIYTGYKTGTGTIQVGNSAGIATSTGKLSIKYNYMEAYNNNSFGGIFSSTLNDYNGLGGYTFHLNNAVNNNVSLKESIQWAIDTWTCATGVNFRIGAPTTSAVVSNDTETVVFMDPSMQVGVLITTWVNYTKCNSNSIWSRQLMDMSINPKAPSGYTWNFGSNPPTNSQYDFRTAILHEFGHANNLDHVNDQTELMRTIISNGSSTRTISQGTLEGGIYTMSISTIPPACGPPEMILKSCATGIESINQRIRNFEIYPTPASDRVIVDFDITTGSYIELCVYDVYGQKINTLTQSYLTAGTYKYTMDASGLSAGVYFMKLNTSDGDKVQRKVMIIK